jgi:hypothetical protein
MSDFKIISIEPKSNDLLLITAQVGVETVRVGTDDDGETPIFEERPIAIEARGWVSATTNHFDADAYDPATGHRTPDAKPREMTEDEKRAYAERVVREQHPDVFEGV